MRQSFCPEGQSSLLFTSWARQENRSRVIWKCTAQGRHPEGSDWSLRLQGRKRAGQMQKGGSDMPRRDRTGSRDAEKVHQQRCCMLCGFASVSVQSEGSRRLRTAGEAWGDVGLHPAGEFTRDSHGAVVVEAVGGTSLKVLLKAISKIQEPRKTCAPVTSVARQENRSMSGVSERGGSRGSYQ